MTERNFRASREEEWQRFESLLRASKSEFRANAGSFPARLRSLAGDLNTAKASGFDTALIERLNRLVLDGNHILYGARTFSLKPALKAPSVFIMRTFPRALRSHWRSFAACCLVFYGLSVFFAVLCAKNRDISQSILGSRQIAGLESMYDPQGDNFLKPRDVRTDADMFAFYIFNNAGIAFRTFSGGALAGIGSLVILVFNAVFLGAAAGHIINAGFAKTFFSFTSGHSAFELTGIVISAQAGFLLGFSVLLPRGISRGAALREAGKTAFPLIAGAAILIFFAAVIEGFWSPRNHLAGFELTPELHYAAGAAAWILIIIYFIFAGRKEAGAEKRI